MSGDRKKKFTDLMEGLLTRSEKSLLEVEREVRQRRREKAAARTSDAEDTDSLRGRAVMIVSRIRSYSTGLLTRRNAG